MRKRSHGVPRNSSNFTQEFKSHILRFATHPGNTTLTGRFGNQNATTLYGFQDALGNLGRVGMTLGGGCFFGHDLVEDADGAKR
jgi:hypothetical protein